MKFAKVRKNREILSAAERELQRLANEEIEAFNRKAFAERGEFLWCEFPLDDRCLEVLKAAALSSKSGCKGGLVRENGQPNLNLSRPADTLRAYGLLGKRETPEEFQVTELGLAMLRAFAPETHLRHNLSHGK